jgi:hypothetical protein
MIPAEFPSITLDLHRRTSFGGVVLTSHHSNESAPFLYDLRTPDTPRLRRIRPNKLCTYHIAGLSKPNPGQTRSYPGRCSRIHRSCQIASYSPDALGGNSGGRLSTSLFIEPIWPWIQINTDCE